MNIKIKTNRERLTNGKEYKVIDMNKIFSHYIILDDNGDRYRLHAKWDENDFEIVH